MTESNRGIRDKRPTGPEERERSVEVLISNVLEYRTTLSADLLVHAEYDNQETRIPRPDLEVMAYDSVFLCTVASDRCNDRACSRQGTGQGEMYA